MTTFQNLNLNPKILTALEKKGYTIPTPIQLQSIPHILEKKDLLGIAQTGTGKTAAFALPILQNLSAEHEAVKRNHIRCLILTPTRELASQIAENIEGYGRDLHLKHTVIFGGVSENPQIKNLANGQDIVIATPGRLLDLMSQGHVKFSQLEIFVLDEADRMLDMGFIQDIKKIISKLPPERQTLFFSATMPVTISELANSILKSPVKVEITPQSTTVERIDQKVYLVERSNKASLLKHILNQEDVQSVLVFSKTKHGANRVIEFLEKNSIKAEAIHGNKSQGARENALANFRSGKTKVLIATDIAARGIDIPGISHVINFDIPMDPESYVHRIGRTARAGKEGVAISFCDMTEKMALKAVEKVIRFQIPVDTSHPFHGVEGVSGVRKISSGERRPHGEAGNKPRAAGRNLSRGNSAAPREDNRRSEFGERRERTERPERSDRPQRSDRPERSERAPYVRDDRRSDSSERPRFGRDDERSERNGNSTSGNSFKKPYAKPFDKRGNGGLKEMVTEKLGKFFGYKKEGKKDFPSRDSSSRDSSSRPSFGDRDKRFADKGPNYAKKRPFGSQMKSKFGGNKPR